MSTASGGARLARLIRPVVAAGMGAALIVGFGAAQAGSKKSGGSAPAHESAPAHMGGGGPGGGGVHMPSGMGGGAHLPGGMGGGAHLPGAMGGGAHIPGSMGGGAHVPGSMSAGAHMPGGSHGAHVPGSGAHVAGGAGRAAHEAGGHEARGRDGAGREAGDHKDGDHKDGDHKEGGREAGAHEGGRRDAGEAGRAGHEGDHAGHAEARQDPRLGGHARLNTRGLDAARAEHHEPRPFLRADAHRDIARERDFVARHARDFHSRFVRDFSARELAAWRRGLWRNEWHYGRRGWWWEVDGVWYDYEDPVWPYPVEVAALTVYDTPYVDGPDLTAVEAGPDVVAGVPAPPDNTVPPGQPLDAAQLADPGIPPLPPAPTGWFRCGTPDGYYPMLGTCTGPWQLVDDAPLPGAQ